MVRRCGESSKNSMTKRGANAVQAGDRVVLHSLREHKDLNGRMAIVCVDDLIDGKHLLQLEDSMESVRASVKYFTKLVLAPCCDLERTCTESTSTSHNEASGFGDCVLCLKEKCATRCAIPCGHLVACDSCAPRLRLHGQCPLCREGLRDLLKVYLHHENNNSA